MIGEKAPTFTLKNQDDQDVTLSDYNGKWVVLYFYPKDNTSGCTQEACDFTDGLGDFEKLNATILGVSPDSVKKHQNFIAKHDLKVTLLADTEHEVLEAYNAWGKKKMYGKEYFGVIRSTYIIDPEGKVAAEWTKVKVKGHVDAVKAKLEELQR